MRNVRVGSASKLTDERRSFLVLFDTLPGGTGYLHRLTDPDAFLATLLAARDHLLHCPCAGEGRNACHRCLLRYRPEAHAEQVSRTEALSLVEELLFKDADSETVDGWATTDVPSTRAVGLDAQIESDLEARFLALLRRWADVSDDAVLDETGRASGHLRIRTDREVVHWRLTAQERMHHTRTDFTLTRADGPAPSVKVYLDGRRFHAGADHDAPARDAAARTRLRADGHTVFQLTWYDLELFEGRSRCADPVWPPYAGIGQDAAKTAYEHFGGNRAEFADLVFANPVATAWNTSSSPSSPRVTASSRARPSSATAPTTPPATAANAARLAPCSSSPPRVPATPCPSLGTARRVPSCPANAGDRTGATLSRPTRRTQRPRRLPVSPLVSVRSVSRPWGQLRC